MIEEIADTNLNQMDIVSNWINWKYSDENDSEKSRFVVSKNLNY